MLPQSVVRALKTSKVQYLRLSISVWVSQVFAQASGITACKPTTKKICSCARVIRVVVNKITLRQIFRSLVTQIFRRSLYRWQLNFNSSAQAGSVVICAGLRQCLRFSALVTLIRQEICRRRVLSGSVSKWKTSIPALKPWNTPWGDDPLGPMTELVLISWLNIIVGGRLWFAPPPSRRSSSR